MSDNPDVVSLREFIDLRFSGIERELSQVRSAIERLAVEMVTSQQFERIQSEVADQDKRLTTLEQRAFKLESAQAAMKSETAEIGTLREQVNSSESNWRVVRVAIATMAMILVPIVIAMLRNWLGI